MKLIRFAVAAAVALAGTVGPAGSAPAQPYVIPVIVPITGNSNSIGALVGDTLRIFERNANAHGGLRGQPIHFEVHDDNSQLVTAVQLLSTVMAQHPPVILGPTPTQSCKALAALVEKNGPVLYCATPGVNPATGSYVFCSAMALPQFDRGIIRYMRLKGYKRLAIISSTDSSGQTNDEATKTILALPENHDLQVVAWEHINPADISAAAQAARIKAAGAQGIVAWVAGPTFGTVLRALHDVGLDLPTTASGANVNPDELAQFAAFTPTDMSLPGFAFLLPSALQPKSLRGPIGDMQAAYRREGAEISPGGTGYIWDAALIVLSGLRQIGPGATADQLRAYILAQHAFAGVNGIYDFGIGDQHGLSDKNTVMIAFDPKTRGWLPLSRLGGSPLKP